DLVAREAHRADHLVELLARAPDERNALLVFLGARRLADEHERRVGISVAEDGLRVRRRAGAVRALRVVPAAQLVEGGALVGGRRGRGGQRGRRSGGGFRTRAFARRGFHFHLDLGRVERFGG